jgi:hypothetical protein
MQRYLVERSFAPDAQSLVATLDQSAQPTFIRTHDVCGVKWLRSYLAPDQRRSYCIVDGPSPEAVRKAARASGLPADRISEVCTLERNDDPPPPSPLLHPAR